MWGPPEPSPQAIFNFQIMKISDDTLRKIHDTSIVTVADKLGIKLYGMGDENRKACCPYHEDQHPSLHFSTKRGCFKCFVCGAKGDAIKLVQDQENLTFTEACEWIIKECNIVVVDKSVGQQKSVSSVQSVCPLDPSLVSKSLSVNSVFCKSVVSAGYLSDSQLRHAASRYRLGCSKDGGVIFWEIDDQQRVHTGKIMYYQSDCHRDKSHNPTWVHTLMKSHLPANYELQHCLFGLHLLNSHPDPLMGRGYLNERATGGAVKPPNIGGGLAGVDASFSSFLRAEEKDRSGNNGVAIVESEKTAVIMSELIPEFIWLSCGGLQMFKPELLAPLVNHKVVLFPDTDETGEAYNQWLTVLQQAQRQYAFKYPLRISRLLEDKASPEQKQRKIDLVDFLFEVPQK